MITSIRNYLTPSNQTMLQSGVVSVASVVISKYFGEREAPLVPVLVSCLLAFSLYRAWENFTSWLSATESPSVPVSLLPAPTSTPVVSAPAPEPVCDPVASASAPVIPVPAPIVPEIPPATSQELIDRFDQRMKDVCVRILPKLCLNDPQSLHAVLQEDSLIMRAVFTRLAFEVHQRAIDLRESLPADARDPAFLAREIETLEKLLGSSVAQEFSSPSDLDPVFHNYTVSVQPVVDEHGIGPALTPLALLKGDANWYIRRMDGQTVVEAFSESSKKVLDLIGKREPYYKVRIQDGDYQREKKEDKGSKKTDWGYEHPAQNKRTAAVDYLETIGYVRYLIAAVLSGEALQLTQSQLGCLTGYVQGIQSSDLASLPHSYLNDPVFFQAVKQFERMTEIMGVAAFEREWIQFLARRPKDSKARWAELTPKRLSEYTQMIDSWANHIHKFLKDIGGPNEEYFAWYRDQLQNILPLLERIQKGMASTDDISGQLETLASDEMIQLAQALSDLQQAETITKMSNIRQALKRYLKLDDDTSNKSFPQCQQYILRWKMLVEEIAQTIGSDQPVLSQAAGAAYRKVLEAVPIQIKSAYVNHISKDGLIHRYFPNGFPKGFKLPEKE
jgi:hypothetical protein